MKLLISFLFLILSFPSLIKADNISEFELEGISIGDSLLNYISEEEIKKEEQFLYDNKKFANTYIRKNSDIYNIKKYDALSVAYKRLDKKYIVHSIEGQITYKDNIAECYELKKIIETDLIDLFQKKFNSYERPHFVDPTGNSIASTSDMYFDDGATVRVICYDMSQKLSDEKGWWDRIAVIVNSSEFSKFLNNQ